MTHTCIVGGWTEPRGSRPFFTALLLGIPDDQGELRYVGRAASGFTDAQLGLVWKQLHALKSKTSPFIVIPETKERAHWAKPKLEIQVQFSGWTATAAFVVLSSRDWRPPSPPGRAAMPPDRQHC